MRAKSRYTIKQHVARLEQMITKKTPCGYCPAAPKFQTDESPSIFWANFPFPCDICRNFVGITHRCPCLELGPDEAFRRTVEAIKTFRSKEL